MSSSHFTSKNGTFERVPTDGESIEDELAPQTKAHGCTDVVWLGIYFLCFGFMVYVSQYAFRHGDPRKLYRPVDYQGNLCGVDVEGQYIYWCSTGEAKSDESGMIWTEIDSMHPICVSECPLSSATSHSCYDERSANRTAPRADYATHKIGDHACLPQNSKMLKMVQRQRISNWLLKYIRNVAGCMRAAWHLIAVNILAAFLLAYAYTTMLACYAGVIVYACLVVAFLVPVSYGVYLIAMFQVGDGVDGIPNSGDSITDLYGGIACVLGSIIFLTITCCMSSAVNRAVKVIETSAMCMFKTPGLMFEPFLLGFFRVAWLTFLGEVMMYLYGLGEPQRLDSKGNRTFFYYTAEHSFYFWFIFLFTIWMNDLLAAFSQTSVSHAVCHWYFTEKTGKGKKEGAPCTALLKGYIVAWRHLGSLALGSFCIAATKPVRFLLLIFVSAADLVDNGLCGCITKNCKCCYHIFDHFLARLGKNAYIDVAIQGNDFCKATGESLKLLISESKAIMILFGATWIFHMAGIGVVTGCCSLAVFFVVKYSDAYNTPSSEYYIEDPVVMTAICCGIAFLCSVCFMLTFDMVADTMLYCFAYEKQWNKSHPLIETVKENPHQSNMGFFSSFGWNGCGPKRPPPPGQKKKAAPKASKFAPEELYRMVDNAERQ